MDRDDLIYFALLVFTIVIGDFIRRLENVKLKQNVSTTIGFVIVTIVSGVHVLHVILETIVNALIISFAPTKYCHGISFMFSFFYLVVFRLSTTFGLPQPPSHTNAIQMILTLKMVGLALEVYETAKFKKQLKELENGTNKDSKVDLATTKLNIEFQSVKPSFTDIIHYAFCYIGVLTGPYYKYRTYWDMLHSQNSARSFMFHAFDRLKMFPVYAVMFVLCSQIFPLSYALSDEIFEERSVLYRIWYMTPLFFTFRMRFYCGFILSEVACILAGLGAYPVDSQPKPGQGPTNLKYLQKRDGVETSYNFETVHNIDEYNTEMSDFRSALKYWNMTVQWWLVANVHRSFPIKPLRATVTMLVSAFWHGVHSGYYLSMLPVPLVLLAEDAAKKKLRPYGPKLFDAFAIFMKYQWFSYLGVAFSLLAMDVTFAYWKSIYFAGFIAIGVIYLVSAAVPAVAKKSSSD